MSGTTPRKRPSWSHVRSMCSKCYFVLNEDAIVYSEASCPHCGIPDGLGYTIDFGRSYLVDMIEYFYQRGVAVDNEAVEEMSSNLQRRLGLTIDRERLVQTVQRTLEVYEKVEPAQEWSEFDFDEVMDTVQYLLTLPTRDHAIRAWQIIGHYSAVTYDHKMVIVLVNMLLEHLLDGRLIVLAITQDGKDYSSAEKYVYKNLAGIDAKRRYFAEHLPHMMAASPSLPNGKIKEAFNQAFEKCAPANFCSDWDAIRRVRNRFIHENMWTIEMADVQRALRLARQAIPVFAEIQNRYCLKDRTSP